MLKVAIEETGGTTDKAVMIGDSKTDVDTARALGVPVVVVDFGYTAIPAHELGADAVISGWNELLPVFSTLHIF